MLECVPVKLVTHDGGPLDQRQLEGSSRSSRLARIAVTLGGITNSVWPRPVATQPLVGAHEDARRR